jgi:hypothetical protein
MKRTNTRAVAATVNVTLKLSPPEISEVVSLFSPFQYGGRRSAIDKCCNRSRGPASSGEIVRQVRGAITLTNDASEALLITPVAGPLCQAVVLTGHFIRVAVLVADAHRVNMTGASCALGPVCVT